MCLLSLVICELNYGTFSCLARRPPPPHPLPLAFPLHLGRGRFLWLSLCYLFSAMEQVWTWISVNGDVDVEADSADLEDTRWSCDTEAVNEFVRLRGSAFGC